MTRLMAHSAVSAALPHGWLRALRARTGATVPRRDWTEAVSLAVVLVLWELIPRLVELQWLAPLSSAVAAIPDIHQDGVLVPNLQSSLTSLGKGLAIGLSSGLVLGALMGRHRLVEVAFNAYVDVLLFTPSLVFAPIFFSLFGLSDKTRVAVIIIYAAPVVVVNTMTGIKTVDSGLVEMAHSFGMPSRRILYRIQVPAALPLILEGIRLAIGRGIKGMVTGEVLISLVGLGGLASAYGSRLATDRVWAITLIVMGIALAANWVFTRIETRLTAWTN